MDFSGVADIISKLGFPIFCVICMFIMMNKEREDHKNEVDSLKGVIANINETLSALKQLIQDKLN